MAKKMNKLKEIATITTIFAMTIACQKADHNGDLGGFWKLLQIEEVKNDSIIDKREEDCFWAIQLKMITANKDGNIYFCRESEFFCLETSKEEN